MTDKTTFEVQQIIYLLVKTASLDLSHMTPGQRRFVFETMDEWSEEWKKELRQNGNNNETSA